MEMVKRNNKTTVFMQHLPYYCSANAVLRHNQTKHKKKKIWYTKYCREKEGIRKLYFILCAHEWK